MQIGISILIVFYAFGFTGMVISTVRVTKSDPTDPTVAFVRYLNNLPVADQNNYSEYVQSRASMFCNICETFVMEKSKHCVECNRCCAEFDHHCRWVSNDIGGLNYVIFLRMLLFVALTLCL